MEAQVRSHHTHTPLISDTHTHTYIYTFTRSSCTPANAHTLLLRLAEVVAEVVVARWFGDDWRSVGDGDILKVQEAELNLHREQDIQLAAHGFTTHLPAQENAQSICPQAEISSRGGDEV